MLFCESFFFFKQKTAYEMRISDWSSDVCSSDLRSRSAAHASGNQALRRLGAAPAAEVCGLAEGTTQRKATVTAENCPAPGSGAPGDAMGVRSGSATGDRKSDVAGARGAVRVSLGGRRVIKKNRQNKNKRK